MTFGSGVNHLTMVLFKGFFGMENLNFFFSPTRIATSEKNFFFFFFFFFFWFCFVVVNILARHPRRYSALNSQKELVIGSIPRKISNLGCAIRTLIREF